MRPIVITHRKLAIIPRLDIPSIPLEEIEFYQRDFMLVRVNFSRQRLREHNLEMRRMLKKMTIEKAYSFRLNT
jgi:hypothetical protein